MAAVTVRTNGSYASEAVRRSTATARVGKGIRRYCSPPSDEPEEAL